MPRSRVQARAEPRPTHFFHSPAVSRGTFRENTPLRGALRPLTLVRVLKNTPAMTDTSSISVWLAVIAIATSVQALVMVAAALVAWRSVESVAAKFEHFKRQEWEPIRERAERTLAGVDETLARVRSADDAVRHAAVEAIDTARRTVARAKRQWWPLIATAKALTVGFGAFRRQKDRTALAVISPAPRPTRWTDRDDEARFVYEGGTHARN
jgi:hypothetical protein